MRILVWLDDNFEEVFTCVLMVIMTMFICTQVLTRYVLHMAMSWTEEVSRYLFIWTVYVGISYGVKKDKHISVDVFHDFAPPQYKHIIATIGDLLFLGFAFFVAFKGQQVFEIIMDSGQTSPACSIPMWIVYGAMPFGMALASFRLVQKIWRRYNGKHDNRQSEKAACACPVSAE